MDEQTQVEVTQSFTLVVEHLWDVKANKAHFFVRRDGLDRRGYLTDSIEIDGVKYVAAIIGPSKEQRADSFEGQLAKCLKKLVDENSHLILTKKLILHETEVRCITCKDFAAAFNDFIGFGLNGDKVSSATVKSICQDVFKLSVERASEGWVVILDEKKLRSSDWFNLPATPGENVFTGNKE